MKITPINKSGSHKTGVLTNVTVRQINAILGFKPNVQDDPCKVKHSWGFTAEYVEGGIKIPLPGGCLKIGKKVKKECGIWDYKGSETVGRFSTYGTDDVFFKLFGNNYGRY